MMSKRPACSRFASQDSERGAVTSASGTAPSQLPNPISPDLLSGPERIASICEILAAGLTRLHAKKSSRISPAKLENFLDIDSEESGHRPKPLRKVQQ